MAEAPPVAAILLAAGRSSRMGAENKLLIPYEGRPMVRAVAENVLASRARPLIVVTGHEAGAVREALDGLDAVFVHNPDFAEGLSTSLRAGLGAVPGDAPGVLVALGDMPQIATGDIDRLLDAFAADPERDIVMAAHAGRRGNPVVWARRYLDELKAVTGDAGGRGLLEGRWERVRMVEIGRQAVFDVDTPADVVWSRGATS